MCSIVTTSMFLLLVTSAVANLFTTPGHHLDLQDVFQRERDSRPLRIRYPMAQKVLLQPGSYIGMVRQHPSLTNFLYQRKRLTNF
uniref:Secreted protein n=1 Tax=Steinernema glaseri TaxID=37863 RepID=A0A1I7XZA8_9BILA